MEADFAEVGTADFSEICLLVSVADEARTLLAIHSVSETHLDHSTTE